MAVWTVVEWTPQWRMFVEAEDGALRRAMFAGERPEGSRMEERKDDDPVLVEAAGELREYFAGKRRVFTVPFDLDGTEFQCRVWEQLWKIPYGETRTYADIARALGMRPGASRAVGQANGANPLAVIVPCHRVVATGGGLGGYGGGLDIKYALLKLEGVLL